MQDHHDRDTGAGVQGLEQLEDLELVAEVQKGRRLVEQQNRGLLGEGHGDPRPLALTAGQGVHLPVGELDEPGLRESPFHRFGVVGRLRAEEPLVRVAAVPDEPLDGETFRGRRPLRQHGEPTGHLLRRILRNQLSVEINDAVHRLQQSRQGPERGRLPAPVRTDDRGDRPHVDGQVQIVDDDEVVSEIDSLGAQAVSRPGVVGGRSSCHHTEILVFRRIIR